MNKLKKPAPHVASEHPVTRPVDVANEPSQSRTMMYARAMVPATISAPKALGIIQPTVKATVTVSRAAQPATPVEQYWAARALTAEAFLSARVTHQAELLAFAVSEEQKRTRELAALHQSHEQRHARLEMLVIALLACLVATVAACAHTTARNPRPASHGAWLQLPSHFTVPVLSPFTSVVEHETSIFSTKFVSVCVVTAAVLAYACFRYWLSHATRRQQPVA